MPVRFAKRSTTLALLAYLILQRGAPVARSSLAFTLFPDESEDKALAELRRYLYLAATALPSRSDEPWFVADAETVRWNGSAACRIDVVAFEKSAQDPSTYAAAADLYAGDLLKDVYDDWVVVERERLRGTYLALLQNLALAHRHKREHGEVLRYAQQLLTVDPWREDVLRLSMAAHYAAGDSAGALAAFADFAKRLREEIGVAPMPETLAVRDSILGGEPIPGDVRAPPGPGTSERGTRTPFLPFVGREPQLELLRAGWSRAARGAGNTLLIGGEAGIGKTRLCAEFATFVEAEGGRVFFGGTSSPESVPYQCLIEALRSALPLLVAQPLAPVRLAVLSRVFPGLLQSGAALPALAPLTLEQETARLLDALAEAAAGLARPRPLLLILEDLHWAGSATLQAFARVARRAGKASMLILATYRDEEVGPSHLLRSVARELRAEDCLWSLELARLTCDDVAALVADLEALPERNSALVASFYKHTEGNPLFLNETITDALERRFDATAGPAGVGDGIVGMINARTSQLADETRTVAEVAAIAGFGCNAELVREVTALSPRSLSVAFNELLDRRIMREAGAQNVADYVFTHHLIVAAIYGGIDPSLRARRHARIAHILERTYADRSAAVAGDLARHFDSAGLDEDAARWYAEAARTSAAVFAMDEAMQFANRALELEKERARRVELLRLREMWLGQRGNRAEQRADLDALEVALGDCALPERFDLLRRRALLARSLGDTDAERTLIDAMAEVAERNRDPRLQAEVFHRRAAHAVSCSRQGDAREPAAEALALFETLADGPAQVSCLSLLVDIAANIGDHAALRDYRETLRERSSTQTDRAVEAQALGVAAHAALLVQNYRESRDLTRELLPLTEMIGDRDAEALAHGRLAVTSAWLEEFDEASAEFDCAIVLLEATGNKRALSTTLTNRVLLAMRLGRFGEAQTLIERSSSLLDVVQERRMAVANATNMSFVRLQLGDVDGALQFAREAHHGARALGFPVFEAAALANLGNAERADGQLAEAIHHMESGLALRREHQAPEDFTDDLADLTLAYAEAGRSGDALRCAEEVAALAQESLAGAFWPHYVLYAAARGFAAGGDEPRARVFGQRARTELNRFANLIHDVSTRSGFLALRMSVTIASSPCAKHRTAG
ncbi:MAG: AAA family ATPase [Candidatus Eremiobacteraeota bacterium]|nr:AAA family ATPase [Candidatus Eremiobacteraeota bacterium]